MVGVVGSSPIAPTNCCEFGTQCWFNAAHAKRTQMRASMHGETRVSCGNAASGSCFLRDSMPNIRLPDGSVKTFDRPVSVAELAQSIGAGLARAALAAKVDG